VLGRLYEGNDPGGAWLPYPKHRELTMSNEKSAQSLVQHNGLAG
jgi:hypothetical protein